MLAVRSSICLLGRRRAAAVSIRGVGSSAQQAPPTAAGGGWKGHQGGQQHRFANWVSTAVAGALVGFGAYKGYEKYRKNQRRRESCEAVPDSTYIKAYLPLVRYRGCVLPEDLVMSGIMEEVANFELRPEDVVVASFPKSGTTWLQEVVYLLCHLSSEEPKELRDSVMETKFPYLEFAYPGMKDIRARQGKRFIKTHLPCHLLPASVTSSKAKVIYIYRNPKDVAVSYYNFARMLTYINFAGKFDNFAQLLVAGNVPYAPYFPHVNDYRRAAADVPKQFLTLSYEDMKEDPARQIRKVAEFLGLEAPSEEAVRDIAAKTSFEAMRANPRTNYEHWDTFGLRNKKGPQFMRKGVVGDFENYFADQYLTQQFDEWIKSGTESTGLTFKYKVGGQQEESSKKL